MQIGIEHVLCFEPKSNALRKSVRTIKSFTGNKELHIPHRAPLSCLWDSPAIRRAASHIELQHSVCRDHRPQGVLHSTSSFMILSADIAGHEELRIPHRASYTAATAKSSMRNSRDAALPASMTATAATAPCSTRNSRDAQRPLLMAATAALVRGGHSGHGDV